MRDVITIRKNKQTFVLVSKVFDQLHPTFKQQTDRLLARSSKTRTRFFLCCQKCSHKIQKATKTILILNTVEIKR